MDTTRAAWDLRRASLSCIRRHHYEVAVLPVGAVEAHNRHLPEGMDVIHSEYVALDIVSKGLAALSIRYLPSRCPLRRGLQPDGLSAYCTCFTEGFGCVYYRILLSLRKHGIRKVVIINGHGGNDFKPLARQIQYETDIYLLSV